MLPFLSHTLEGEGTDPGEMCFSLSLHPCVVDDGGTNICSHFIRLENLVPVSKNYKYKYNNYNQQKYNQQKL